MKQTLIALLLVISISGFCQSVHTRLDFIDQLHIKITNIQQVSTAYQVTGSVNYTTGVVLSGGSDTITLASCGTVHVAPLNMLTCIESLATCVLPIGMEQVARQTGSNLYYESTEAANGYILIYSDGSREVVKPVLQRKGNSYFFNFKVY